MPKVPSPEKRTQKNRRRLTSDERRQKITESARGVFIAHGLAGARTRDIAAAAGINEALLYQHFSSKNELYEAAIASPLEEAVAALVAASGAPPAEFDTSGETMHERTSRFVGDLLKVMQDIAPLLGVALFGEAEASRTYYLDRIAPTIETIKDVVAANLASWKHRDFDVELVVQTMFGAAWFHATVCRLNGTSIDVERVADQLTMMVLDGLADRN